MLGKALLAASTLTAVTVAAMPASAQDADIIVTARKRNESILKVPIIEAAVTEKALSNFGTHDIKTLASQVPSLNIGTNVGNYGNQVSIRGIGNTTLNNTVDQAVSLNIDGLALTQALAYGAGLFDVGQVEVLKGPQALFYGKSSTGGVISLRSNDPTSETEVIGRFGYEGEAREKKGELILSGPLTETLKLRLASSYSTQHGFFINDATGIPALGGQTLPRRFAPSNELILRGTALWSPDSNLTVRLKGTYDRYHLNNDNGQEQLASCPNGIAAVPGLPPFFSPNEDCKVDRHIHLVGMNPALFPGVSNDGVPFLHMQQAFGTAEINYRASSTITLTSLTGYYHVSEKDLFNATNTGAAGPLFVFDSTFRMNNVSQEFRANSDFAGPLNFTLGAYYLDGTSHVGLDGTFNSAIIPTGGKFQKGEFVVGNRTYSAFAQLRYKILPELELAAGARWLKERHTLDETSEYPRFDNLGNLIVPIGVIATGVPRISSSHLNPEVSLTYTPTDQLTFFASYKEAAKSGGFQTSILQPAGTDLSFKDERVRGGEIGVKGRTADHALAFTANAYFYNYSNLQVGENLTTAEGILVRTINAATARVRGAEATLSYSPPAVTGLNLHASLNYGHARFGKFLNGPCWGGQTIAQGCNLNPNPLLIDPATGKPQFTNQDLSGRPLLKAPNWSLNFGASYELPVGGDMVLSLASNTNYSGRYYVDLAERDDMVQRAYWKTDLSATLRGPKDRWELAFIGNNLFNKLTTGFCSNTQARNGNIPVGQITGGTTSGTTGPDEVQCTVDRGRELWVRLTLKPFAR